MFDFVSADWHFNHDNIIKHTRPQYSCIEEMDEALVKNWNDVVGKRDNHLILGDWCFKNHSKFIGRLNGKKFLVTGNHDKMNQKVLRCFSEVYNHSVYKNITYNGKKRRWWFSHFPNDSWWSSAHGTPALHGHCHGRAEEKPWLLRFDVGVDLWDYKPIPWNIIEAKMKDKEIEREEFLSKQDTRFIDRIRINRKINKKYIDFVNIDPDKDYFKGP